MNFNKILQSLFGNKSTRDMKLIQPIVEKIKAEYENIKTLSNDELRAKTKEIQQYVQSAAKEEKAKIAELKAKIEDTPASEYYKYFVNITYEVFNQYGSPASGGERSEYNLLQELSDGVKNNILILDEPESSFDNIFLRDGVDSLLKDISKTIPVIIATHNNTIGVSVHPDYIVYACKEVLSDGKLEYHLYSGYPSSEDLVDLKGNHISRKSVLLDCLEAGEAAYMDRRNSYEILNG